MTWSALYMNQDFDKQNSSKQFFKYSFIENTSLLGQKHSYDIDLPAVISL